MADQQEKNEHTDENGQPDVQPTPITATMNLSDERRVKAISPGMMVYRRFIRNRLAIIGLP